MTDQPMPSAGPPSMRASNQDREQVAKVLQQAMSEGRISVAELETRLDSVYAATTLAQLQPLTVDLPGHGLSLTKSSPMVDPTLSSSTTPVIPMFSRAPDKANLVAIFSGVERKGVWLAPTHINAVAVFGGIVLDFSGAQFGGMETVINVTAIMGGVEITVPEGVTVVVQGVGIMGAFADSAHQNCGPGAPVLRVRGFALMGGVEVKSSRRPIGS